MDKNTDITEEQLKNTKVRLYGANWCGACNEAKKIMEEHGVEFDYIEVNKDGNIRKLKEILPDVSTIPQIFTLNDNNTEESYLGGFPDLKNILNIKDEQQDSQ